MPGWRARRATSRTSTSRADAYRAPRFRSGSGPGVRRRNVRLAGVSEPPGVESLYALPPEQFVVARSALAKEIRARGDRVEATRVAKLRRPPASAWALNQVARTDPQLINELLEAGGELRAAMSDAMAGDASSLRTAETAERATVEAILSAAAAQLEGQG